MNENETTLRERFLQEMRRYIFYAAFLSIFFLALTLYQRLLLEEYSLAYFRYGYAFIQALILAKIILVGEYLGLGENFSNRSLVIPVLCKTVLFSLLVAVFSFTEHYIDACIHHEGFNGFLDSFMKHGKDALLAKVLIVFLYFILFFSFVEINNVMGEGKLFKLFFKRESDT